MENKKYLDKVLDHLVRSTEIDYEGKELYVPFTNYSFHFVTREYRGNNYSIQNVNVYDIDFVYIWNPFNLIFN